MGPFSHSISIALLYSFTSGFTHHRRRNLSVVSFLELSHKKYKLIFHKKKFHYLYFIAFYLQSVIAALQLSLSSRNFGFRLSPDDIWWLDPGGLDESLTKCAVLGVGCRRGSPHPHLIQCEGSLGWDTVFAKYSSSCGKPLCYEHVLENLSRSSSAYLLSAVRSACTWCPPSSLDSVTEGWKQSLVIYFSGVKL